MNKGINSVSLRDRTDQLMLSLYQCSRGKLHQTLVANYRIADAFRRSNGANTEMDQRLISSLACGFWRLSLLLPDRLVWVFSGVLFSLASLPELLWSSLKLHTDAFSRQGAPDGHILLLRTGVANEPKIARWIENELKAKVLMLQYNENTAPRIAGLAHLPLLLSVHAKLCFGVIKDIRQLLASSQLASDTRKFLVPVWLTLIARQAKDLSWHHAWAKTQLAGQDYEALYFTMNYSCEHAFMQALPALPATYVEHGFPRRDLPPLPCTQYVYSKGYAEYLWKFDPSLEVRIIGLDYFDKGDVTPSKTIVLASLQDWPQFGIDKVRDAMNTALAAAREGGWKLVFRTRRYDTDAFYLALSAGWDEISDAGEESFDTCLKRTGAAMVWTTWSTAVLDAAALGVTATAFVTPELDEFFITDLHEFARVVDSPLKLSELCRELKQGHQDSGSRQVPV
jgi:hypothetical protein